MPNPKLEEYLKDLSPELQEKARQCKTIDEFREYAAENDLEIPEETLELVAGGICTHACEHRDCDVLAYDRYWLSSSVVWGRWWKKKCKKCGEIIYAVTYEDSFRYDVITEAQYEVRYSPRDGKNHK